MKSLKMFEEFLNEARVPTSKQLGYIISGDMSRVEGTKISKEDAQKLLNIYNLMNTGGQRMFDQKSVKDLLSAYAKELKENSINEGRSIEQIDKERISVVRDMTNTVSDWKSAKQAGDKDAESMMLQKLKDLTAKKKKLEIELNSAIAGKDRDIELVISEGESVKKGIHDHWKEIYNEDFTAAYPKVAKILKNRQNIDRREFARIWEETYGEDFKKTHTKIWDVMD